MRRSWIKSTADLIPSSLALVQADVRLLVELTLKSLAKVVTTDKTKCRPLKHKLVHETLALESLGSAWLEILRRPWLFDGAAAEEPLPIIEDTDDAGTRTRQVAYTKYKHVAAYLSFERFIGHGAKGPMRYDIGRDSNYDIMVVSLPLISTLEYNRAPGLVTAHTQFETTRINGLTGRLTRAHALTGMMTKIKYQKVVIAWVRANLPQEHNLYQNGWINMPGDRFELDMAAAIPGAPAAALP